MEKVVLVIVALIAALVLTSCGAASTASGEGSATPESTATAAAQPAPAPVALEVPRPFVVTANTPDYFQEALKQKDPILIMFYGDDAISQEVLKAVKETYNSEDYAAVVEFLLLKNEESDEAIELARNFAVGYIPYTAVVDRDGQIVMEKTGYVDMKVLEQALYDVTNN